MYSLVFLCTKFYVERGVREFLSRVILTEALASMVITARTSLAGSMLGALIQVPAADSNFLHKVDVDINTR